MQSFFLSFLGLGLVYLCSSVTPNGPLVYTKQGALRGIYKRVKGKATVVHSYLGVPFAKPPVGPLRLARPQPSEGWEGVRDATTAPPECLQNQQMYSESAEDANVKAPEISEDCLYLNIYTPATPKENAKLPVMVFIHGGALVLGSASPDFYDGSALAAYQNVVVVTIQYRLGMLGFLSTGDDNAPGNLGFLDQVAALQWVQENIQSFGGDPSSVTIFGESAGGVSVSLLLLSPLSSGLFHRAIAESGTAAMDLLTNIPPMQTALTVSNVSNCGATKPHEIVDCVMKMSKADILNVIKNTGWIYGSAVDGYFLPKDVKDIFSSKEFHKLPLINGMNNNEGGWLLSMLICPPGWQDGMDHDTVKKLVSSEYQKPKPGQAEDWIADMLLDEYMDGGRDPIKNRDGFTEFYGDLLFTIPGIHTSNVHRDSGAPVYMYELQVPPSTHKVMRPSFVKVDHCDDIAYVFGWPFLKDHIMSAAPYTDEDEKVSKTIMSYWGNFARTGSPNGPGLPHWPMYGVGEEYLGIGLQPQVGNHLKAQRFTFMTQTLPNKIQERKRQQQKHNDEL